MHSLKLFNLFRKKKSSISPKPSYFPETSRFFPKFPEFCRSELDKNRELPNFVGLNLTKLPILPFLSVLNRQKNKNFSFTKFKRVVVVGNPCLFLFVLLI